MPRTYRLGRAEQPLPDGVGLDLCGFLARNNPGTGQRDALHVRALCLDDGTTKIVWAAADVLAISAQSASRIRREAARRFGVKPGHITVSATHTHSAPATVFLANCGSVNRGWLRGFEAIVIETIGDAIRNTGTRVHAEFAATDATGFARNRRTLKRDGSLTMGVVPPEDTQRRGPENHTLSVLTLRDAATDRPVAGLVHFACHAVLFCDQLITADWPGRMLATVKREMGGGFFPMFIQGACGDINPANLSGNPQENLIRMGDGLAEKALECISMAGERQPALLSARLGNARLPWRSLPTEEALREQLLAPENWRAATRERQAIHLTAKRLIGMIRRGVLHPWATMPVQAVRAGNVVFAALGGEILTQTARDLAAAFPSHHLLCAAYANGSVGYLPSAEEYAYGGYEVERAHVYYGNPDAFATEAEAIARAAAENVIRSVIADRMR